MLLHKFFLERVSEKHSGVILTLPFSHLSIKICTPRLNLRQADSFYSMQRSLRVDINDSHLWQGFKCQVLPQKKKANKPNSIKAMKKEAQNSGFGHLCESDTASVLGLSSELLHIGYNRRKEWIKLVELWKPVSSSDWKPMRLAFLSGNLTPVMGSVVPQVTSWAMAPAATAVIAKGKKLLKRLSENKYCWLKDEKFRVDIQK